MQSAEGPPTYTEYPTELPDEFPIGRSNVPPLVNVTELEAHLRLLGAIHKLKADVQAQEEGVAATNKDKAWVVFVNKAVHRFYKWNSSSWSRQSLGLNETLIPPLDIIMVWHSYLLNPRAYYEDSQRMHTSYCTNLQAIHTMPLTLISSLIDPHTLDPVPPLRGRKASFERETSLMFSLPLVIEISDVVHVDCPLCLHKNRLVKWVDAEEKGFAEPKFTYTCESCQKVFNKSNIGVRRFAEEFTLRRTGKKVYISETLLDPRTGRIDTEEAAAFSTRVFKYIEDNFKLAERITPDQVPSAAKDLAIRLRYDSKVLSDCLHVSVRPNYMSAANPKPLPKIQRVVVAYSTNGLASLDLVGAVLRQGAFVDKMVELGWTQPGRFNQSSELAPLIRSIARYHAFLDLMIQHPNSLLVPTLDIDLAWHSHQLKGEHYRDDTLNHLGRTPNHDDSIDSFALSKGYDITAKVWRARFGVPYSVCGCIPDRDQESRISRFASSISKIGKKDKEVIPVPLPINTRPDLVSIEDDEADSSHPSEHNLVFGDPESSSTLKNKEKRMKKSMKCVANAKKSGSRDPWRALQAERNETREKAQHREAFTDPHYGYGYYYPYWGVSMPTPYGFYGGNNYGGVPGACGSGCGASGCGGSGGGCSGGCGGGGCG